MRLFARRRPNIAKLRRRGDLSGIRAALRYQDLHRDADEVEWDLGGDVRVEAVEALATFYGPVVGEGLAAALHDDDPDVRLAAVRGIAGLGAPVAAETLIERELAWDGPEDAEAAGVARETLVSWRLEGLAEIFAERLARPSAPQPADHHRRLLADLLAADPRGQDAAAAVATSLVFASAQSDLADQEDRIERILGWLGPPAVERVLETLETGSPEPGLVRAAGELGDSRAVEPLLRLSRHPDPLVRRSAATALGRLRDTRAVTGLLGATRDSNRDVRDAAFRALDDMGTAAVIVGVASLVGGDGLQSLDAGAMGPFLSAGLATTGLVTEGAEGDRAERE